MPNWPVSAESAVWVVFRAMAVVWEWSWAASRTRKRRRCTPALTTTRGQPRWTSPMHHRVRPLPCRRRMCFRTPPSLPWAASSITRRERLSPSARHWFQPKRAAYRDATPTRSTSTSTTSDMAALWRLCASQNRSIISWTYCGSE